jgi:colanic acid biosynthesis glycosyl transferase WcaI
MGQAPLLFIGLNYAPEPVGIGPYSAGLCEALARAGHPVTAVVGKPYYPQWRVDPAYDGGGWKQSEENGVRVIRCPHFVPAEPTGLARIGHLASFALTSLPAAFAAALRTRPKVVLCVAPALLSVACAWIVARLCGAKLWIHVQDFEVEAALATGLMQEQLWPAKLGLWIEGLYDQSENACQTG